MQELRDNLGIGTLYADATVEECTQAAEKLCVTLTRNDRAE